ncbi:hypothetical protein AKJ16_DCAP02940 [Drosera capensis]
MMLLEDRFLFEFRSLFSSSSSSSYGLLLPLTSPVPLSMSVSPPGSSTTSTQPANLEIPLPLVNITKKISNPVDKNPQDIVNVEENFQESGSSSLSTGRSTAWGHGVLQD